MSRFAVAVAAVAALLALAALPARAQDPSPPAPVAAPAPAAAAPAPTPAAVAAAASPWGVLGIVGGAVAGLGAGVISVSTVVLLQESATTDHGKRAIEISIGGAAIVIGGALIVVDALTE